MGIEMGAKTAVCPPDEKALAFVRERAKRQNYEPVWADEDAGYERTLHYRLEDLVPVVAKPNQVDNRATVTEVEGMPIDQAFLGTCTNGRLEDLRLAAAVLRDRRVQVRTMVIPASVDIFRKAIAEGLIDIFLRAGCVIEHPGCGPCIGVQGGVLGENETVISTANRTFYGRNGARTSLIYLASPLTVAASAVEGRICDPRRALSEGRNPA